MHSSIQRMAHTALLLLLLSLPVLLGACGDDTPRYDDRGRAVDGTPEADIEVSSPTFSVLNILRATDNSVKVVGTVSRPFFEGARGNTLLVNGGIEMEVYEFDSKEALENVAKSISPDGMKVNGEEVTWPAAPHMFKTDRVILIYFGEDRDNRAELATAFGQQFAGAP